MVGVMLETARSGKKPNHKGKKEINMVGTQRRAVGRQGQWVGNKNKKKYSQGQVKLRMILVAEVRRSTAMSILAETVWKTSVHKIIHIDKKNFAYLGRIQKRQV